MCSDVPDPAVSGVATPAELFLLPAGSEICPRVQGSHRCSGCRRAHRRGYRRAYGARYLEAAPAVAGAGAIVAGSNHPGVHAEGRHPAEVEEIEPAKRRSPPKAGTPLSAYGANRPKASSIAAWATATEVLCASGRASARGCGEGQHIGRERGEGASPTVHVSQVQMQQQQQ